jgi:TolA-binding protein
MSLFNQTVAKAASLEEQLAAANKRIADLEKALKNSRAVNAQMLKRFGREAVPVTQETRSMRATVNSLSADEVDELFRQNADQAKMAELADAGDLKSPAYGHPGSIPGLGTKFKGAVCALFKR